MTDDIAALIAMAVAKPVGGPDDLALYTGVVQSWDEASGVNAVLVNQTVVPNLRVIQSGIGLAYQAGDTVMVQRKGTQYYITGKIGAPGAGASNQIQSQTIGAGLESTGSSTYTNLTTYGPEVTVYVGSSRRCLVLVSAYIQASGTIATLGQYIGGSASVTVSGASSIGHGPIAAGYRNQALVQFAGPTYGAGGGSSVVGTRLLTSLDGLNQGQNTFTVQYKSDQTSPTVGFQQRNITVIPF